MRALRNCAAALRPVAARVGEAVGRLIYPPHCVVCDAPLTESEDRYLCPECIGAISYVQDPTCPKCGHELGPHADGRKRCPLCRNLPLLFDRAVAAAHHDGPARDLVLGLKFGAQIHNAFPLATLLAARLGDTNLIDCVDVIVPVPLHRSRRRARGFNQSEILAEELGERLDLCVVAGRLVRTVNTAPQTQVMSVPDRRANVRGAFALRRAEPFRGKSVLLVDDVLTTGATAGECARVLKDAGARRVFVATVTRRMSTPPHAHGEAAPEGDPAPEP